jgi:hypothetical protein
MEAAVTAPTTSQLPTHQAVAATILRASPTATAKAPAVARLTVRLMNRTMAAAAVADLTGSAPTAVEGRWQS